MMRDDSKSMKCIHAVIWMLVGALLTCIGMATYIPAALL